MPAYNFLPQFADDVESGKKRQTIRKKRKRPTVIGDILYLYTGQRTKQCRSLGKAICFEVVDIEIWTTGVLLDGKELTLYETAELVRADGFRFSSVFFDFFVTKHGRQYAWKGELIKW